MYSTFPELFLEISGRDFAHYPAAVIYSDTTAHNLPLRHDLTWGDIVCDLHRQVQKLLQLSGRSPRFLDEEPLTVGVIDRSGYPCFLLIVATMMLRWTVSSTRSIQLSNTNI
jgi:hypothetical protein